MQVTIPSPPVTEYTFTTDTIKVDTSIGRLEITDSDIGIELKLFLNDHTNENTWYFHQLFPRSIVITTKNKIQRR